MIQRGDIIQSECLGFGGMETLIKAFTIFSKLRYNLDYHPTHCMIAVSDTQCYSAEASGMIIVNIADWLHGGYKLKVYRPQVSNQVMEYAIARELLTKNKPYAWWQFEVHIHKWFREVFNILKHLIGWKWLKQKDTKKMRALFTSSEVCTESVYRYMQYLGSPQSDEFDETSINNCDLEHILINNPQFFQQIQIP